MSAVRYIVEGPGVYVRVDAQGRIGAVYNGAHPELQLAGEGERWVEVVRFPVRGEDRFVDLNSDWHEMYRETPGDRRNEVNA